MTHEVLPSDIEFARRLVHAGRPDGEVVAALVRRKVELAEATRLVAELRGGRTLFPEVALNAIEAAEQRSSPQRNPSAKRGKRGRPVSSRISREKRAESPSVRYATIGLGLVAIAGLAIALSSYWYPFVTTRLQARSRRIDTPVSASVLAAARPELILQVREDGLHIGQDWVPHPKGWAPNPASRQLATRQNTLEILSLLIGPPTRTNRLDQPERTLHSFERHGLIVYSENGDGRKSIVIDFEALGGTNGTESPFTGVFQLDNERIDSGTDPVRLAGIKELSLTNRMVSSGIFAGRYRQIGLCFAYHLKKAQRLSVVEIDLE